MDLKRFGLFLVLSWAILLGSNMLFGKRPNPQAPAPVSTQDAGTNAGAGVGTGATLEPQAAIANGALPWEETLVVGPAEGLGRFRASFSSLGGVLAELRTADYFTSGQRDLDKTDPINWMPLVKPVRTPEGVRGSLSLRPGPSGEAFVPYNLEEVHWEHEVLNENGVVWGVRFWHKVESTGLLIEKTLRLEPGKHEWQVELALTGGPGETGNRTGRFLLTPAMGMVNAAADPYYKEPKARACGESDGDWIADSKMVDPKGNPRTGGFSVGDRLLYAGVDNKYFAMLLRAAEGPEGDLARASMADASWRLEQDPSWTKNLPKGYDAGPYRHVVADMGLNLAIPADGERLVCAFRLYSGPKERDEFASILPAHEGLLRKDLGYFDGIATFLLKVLQMFHGLVGNWGVAIILLTLTVRLALFPFNRRSQTHMARHATKMKRVQPKINEIKEKYKNDPKKLREEQARIMQEEGAFPPLGGCLPPLVQIPIFFGLFSALRVAFELRHAPFLWVTDLSMPDRLAHLGWNTHLPFVGVLDWLNILPLLMVVLWIVQQKVMPKPTDPQAMQMQKMMMWMPILFGVFLYNYAAGLSLYMVTSSLFGIFEYTIVRRIWPLDDTEQPKKQSKLAARLQEAMKEAQRMQEAKASAQRGGKSGGKGGGKKGR
ncbi:MAG: membrane protein insertase YidC [Planctomycetota bacterium]